ncbi:MAG TPA: hypothetical protein VFX65_07090 [Candidatus Limnocylindrales bacterium]|nr:hypothetical protein [Candidatus Limnocylindrales bacterium]
MPSPTPALVDAGTITLSDTGCTWDGNPGSMPVGPLTLAVRNDTEDFGTFILHRVRDDKSWSDGQAAIVAIQGALEIGAEWPEWTFEVSDPVDEATADAGRDGVIRTAVGPGVYGVVCSANTSPTGDILTTFLVGPLEVPQP